MGKLPEGRENTSGQVRLVLGLLSDWLRGWHKISGPIPERDEAIPQKILESLSAFNEKLPIKLGRLNLDKTMTNLRKGFVKKANILPMLL